MLRSGTAQLICQSAAPLGRPGYPRRVPDTAYRLHAELVGHPGVVRVFEVRGETTLEDVHTLLRAGFGWDEDHLYAFWLDGEFWSDAQPAYEAPFELEESGGRSAEIALDALELQAGQRIAYLFDFGDEWRVALTVEEIAAAAGRPLPRLVAESGEAPPQYPDFEE